MTKRSTTMNRGADDERVAWMRKLHAADRALVKSVVAVSSDTSFFRKVEAKRELVDDLIVWGEGRSKRASAKAGGLGRK